MIPVLVLGAGLGMMLVERLIGARRWPVVPHWWPRALALNGVQGIAAFVGPYAWDRWWPRSVEGPFASLGLVGEAVVGYLAITFIYYWWHRTRHAVPFLWRWFHQVHHSPARIEIITSFYKHPFEIVTNALLSSAILYVLVGTRPEAAALAVMATGLAEFFYHWNVATPRWLGYFVQRPESHCVHHQRGLHDKNYADLPIWDMLFGTFQNPRAWTATCGLGIENELRLGDMLRGRLLEDAPGANP